MIEGVYEIRHPDPARALRLAGPLTKPVAARLAADIRRLQQQSDEPITVYLRSTGGEVAAFHQLQKVFHPRGKTLRPQEIITVGEATGSAATYLLVLGWRAFATRDAKISIHGVRCADDKQLKTLQRETALALALHLDHENRTIAIALARRMALRLGLRHRELMKSSRRHYPGKEKPWAVFEDFTDRLAGKLSSHRPKRVLYESFDRCRLLLALAKFFPAENRPAEDTDWAVLEAKVFKAAIDYEVQSRREEKSRLRPGDAAELLMDYLLAKDFLPGDHLYLVRRLALTFGRDFLSPAQAARHNQLLRKDPNRARTLLYRLSRPYAFGLWCLTVTLAHHLLAGDHTLTAADARWLGLLDDVLDGPASP